MNRVAIALAILAIVTAIGGVLYATTPMTGAHALTWGVWGISLTTCLISAGIAIARR